MNDFNFTNNNNNLFYITPTRKRKHIVIPLGLYEYVDLNNEIKNKLIKNDGIRRKK